MNEEKIIKKESAIYEAVKNKALTDLGRKMSKKLNLTGLISYRDVTINLDLTVWDNYKKEFKELENRFLEDLKKLGIDLSRNYTNSPYNCKLLGEEIAKKYPRLLEQCKTKIWGEIVNLYEEIISYGNDPQY